MKDVKEEYEIVIMDFDEEETKALQAAKGKRKWKQVLLEDIGGIKWKGKD